MATTRALATTVLTALITSFTSCSAPSGYLENRLMDLTDVVDVRYGTGMGLGVHVQATSYFGAGLGLSSVTYSREWFGRSSAVVRDGAFVHIVLLGSDGLSESGTAATGSYEILLVNLLAWGSQKSDPPFLDRFRLGGHVYLPFIHGGLFVNVGEVVDFAAGLLGYDLAHDENRSKGHEL